ncbi:MAG: GntR family transcriptional regulator [Acidimicrobiales bacterium]
MTDAGKDDDGTARPLDRSHPLPLWAQLRTELERRLDAGVFADRFPTDAELTSTYGVSRQTAREAVRRLSDRLDRQRGKGTFVRPAEFEQPSGALYSLFESIEAHGVEQRSVVRTLDERRDARVAELLGLRATDPLVFLGRLRLAAGAPLALDEVWVPASVGRPLLAADFAHTAFYFELQQRCGIRPDRAEERIEPVLPEREDAMALGLSARQPAFAVERRTFSDGTPLEYRRTIIRGDRYNFVSTWTAAATATPFRLVRSAS